MCKEFLYRTEQNNIRVLFSLNKSFQWRTCFSSSVLNCSYKWFFGLNALTAETHCLDQSFSLKFRKMETRFYFLRRYPVGRSINSYSHAMLLLWTDVVSSFTIIISITEYFNWKLMLRGIKDIFNFLEILTIGDQQILTTITG